MGEIYMLASWNPNEEHYYYMIDKPEGPRVGEKAPEFFIETADGRFPLNQLAARHEKLILTSQDSYRYHPN